jgi:hypothetical protein
LRVSSGGAAVTSHVHARGTPWQFRRRLIRGPEPISLQRHWSRTFIEEEDTMPVIILWGIPTLIVLAGGGYWLMHVHH